MVQVYTLIIPNYHYFNIRSRLLNHKDNTGTEHYYRQDGHKDKVKAAKDEHDSGTRRANSLSPFEERR